MLGFLRRNLHACPEKVKSDCYKTLVRPLLEYGCAVWDPHQKIDIKELEKVQKRAGRFATGNHCRETGNTKINMCQLGWQPLEERRARIKLNTFFKGREKLMEIPLNHLTFKPNGTRGSYKSYVLPSSGVDSHLHSFYPSTVRLWNTLPDAVKDINSADSFKSSTNKLVLRSAY